MKDKEYSKILVNGITLNIVQGDENSPHKNVTLFVDTKENIGVACTCYRNIPSKLEASGRTFRTLGCTFKYL